MLELESEASSLFLAFHSVSKSRIIKGTLNKLDLGSQVPKVRKFKKNIKFY